MRLKTGYYEYMLNYAVLADCVVVIHFIWILFLVGGAAVGVRYRAAGLIHGAALAFAIVIQSAGWYCPLTHLEQWLRMRHDPLQSYSGSFIGHYVEQIVYWDVSPSLIFRATIALVAANLIVYWRVGRKKGKGKKMGPRQP